MVLQKRIIVILKCERENPVKPTCRVLFLFLIIALAGCSSDDESPVSPPLDLTVLDTQAKVDAFGALGHTDYADGLVIGVQNQPNSSIVSLDALKSLTSVKGLAIFYNDALESLSGLDNLVTIGTDGLVIEENPGLTRVDGFSSLVSVGGSAVVKMNGIIADLSGLSNLASVGGVLSVVENPGLTNLAGLSGLESVGGDTLIEDNGNLVSLNGLANLVNIGGTLGVINNPNLSRIDGFFVLETLGGTLIVMGNGLVEDLSGLSNLSSVGGGLIFLDNLSLANYCGLQNLLFAGFNGTYAAVRNASNPTLAEIKAAFCN